MDVRSFTVGPVAENCYIARPDGGERCVVIDPGDEPERLLKAIAELGLKVDAILLTHTHFDHVGAVAPLARETGAEVWCPEIELPVLADIMSFVPWPGFGPYESYDAEHSVAGRRAPLPRRARDRRSVHTRATAPATSPTRSPTRRRCSPATSSSRARSAASTCRAATGRRCWRASAASSSPIPRRPRCTRGTWDITTLGAERATNPFLAELAGR